MAMSSHTQDISITCSFLMTLERSILMMQCGLVIFMFLFAPHLGLTRVTICLESRLASD